MNIYRTEFFARCPVNGVRVKYEVVIKTPNTIAVEALLDEVELIREGMHEEIAAELREKFGGELTLVAFHHGVTIETRLP